MHDDGYEIGKAIQANCHFLIGTLPGTSWETFFRTVGVSRQFRFRNVFYLDFRGSTFPNVEVCRATEERQPIQLTQFSSLFPPKGESREDAGGGGNYIHALLVATLRHFHSDQVGQWADGAVGGRPISLRDTGRSMAGRVEFLHQSHPLRVLQSKVPTRVHGHHPERLLLRHHPHHGRRLRAPLRNH